jgi:hypothetical protein
MRAFSFTLDLIAGGDQLTLGKAAFALNSAL